MHTYSTVQVMLSYFEGQNTNTCNMLNVLCTRMSHHSSILLFAACTACTPGLKAPVVDDLRGAWIESTLDAMTLEQKAGEMTQLTLGTLLEGTDPYEPTEPHRLDPEKVRKAIETHHIGSVLNCGNHAYTLEQWRELVHQLQSSAAKRSPATPILYGVDAVHGANYTTGAALSPQQIGLAATWNPELVHTLAAGTAHELLAAGTPWNFAPILDVGRDPRWPRFWETFGEDPMLVSELGVAAVTGTQSVGAAATMKHFLGYSMPLTGKDRTPAWIPERQLHEIFVPPFRAAIEAGAMSVMINSSEINGIPVHSDEALLTGLLREKLGFSGLVVTDWEDIKYLVHRHHVAATYKDAVEMAIQAGIDLSMVPVDLKFPALVVELVREGRISEDRIDASVRRILALKWDLGLVADSNPPAEHVVDASWRADQRQICLQAAEQSITLLKNASRTLPLSPDQPIWVSGPTAHSLAALNGGWTGTWQGTDPRYDTPGAITAYEALKTHWNADTYHFGLEMDFDGGDIAAAVRDLREHPDAQAAVVFLGELPYCEMAGNDEEVELNANQTALVEALAATGASVVGVYLGGRPRRMEAAAEALDGFIMGYLPGNEGGTAIARVLNGSVNPSGHLPFTWPRKSASHLTYDHKYTETLDLDSSFTAFNPLFEFGSGLNYTTLELVDFKTDQTVYNLQDTIRAQVTLRNTGQRDADDVVHLYSHDHVASITPSVWRLAGFERVAVLAGESVDLAYELPVQQLGFVGRDLAYVVEPGDFTLRIDSLTTTISVNP